VRGGEKDKRLQIEIHAIELAIARYEAALKIEKRITHPQFDARASQLPLMCSLPDQAARLLLAAWACVLEPSVRTLCMAGPRVEGLTGSCFLARIDETLVATPWKEFLAAL